MTPDDETTNGDEIEIGGVPVPPPVVEKILVEAEEAPQQQASQLREGLKRVVDEVEATPVIGDAYDWIRAIALGVKDVGKVMLDEGRKGAQAAEVEAWKRFDAKTKYRRKPRK